MNNCDGSDTVNRIKQLREEIRMTQVRLSIELGVSQETISAYENGKHFPSFENLVKLRNIFNVNIDYIMGLSDVRIQKSNISSQDALVLSIFSHLDNTKKEKALAYLQGISDS